MPRRFSFTPDDYGLYAPMQHIWHGELEITEQQFKTAYPDRRTQQFILTPLETEIADKLMHWVNVFMAGEFTWTEYQKSPQSQPVLSISFAGEEDERGFLARWWKDVHYRGVYRHQWEDIVHRDETAHSVEKEILFRQKYYITPKDFVRQYHPSA